MVAPAGSVIVLFRRHPILLESDSLRTHCTVQVDVPYEVSFKGEATATSESLLLPFVTYPCAEAEEIRRHLYSIVTALGVSREEHSLSASLEFLEILRLLDKAARQQRGNTNPASLVSYKVKHYIAQYFHRPITLSEIAQALEKTPNYVNRLFREANGITINQYISREKVQHIATLIRNHKVPFRAACHSVGITDTDYGYRLFKKHTGVTPGQYLKGDIYSQND